MRGGTHTYHPLMCLSATRPLTGTRLAPPSQKGKTNSNLPSFHFARTLLWELQGLLPCSYQLHFCCCVWDSWFWAWSGDLLFCAAYEGGVLQAGCCLLLIPALAPGLSSTTPLPVPVSPSFQASTCCIPLLLRLFSLSLFE